jgi:hypothetical protein
MQLHTAWGWLHLLLLLPRRKGVEDHAGLIDAPDSSYSVATMRRNTFDG